MRLISEAVSQSSFDLGGEGRGVVVLFHYNKNNNNGDNLAAAAGGAGGAAAAAAGGAGGAAAAAWARRSSRTNNLLGNNKVAAAAAATVRRTSANSLLSSDHIIEQEEEEGDLNEHTRNGVVTFQKGIHHHHRQQQQMMKKNNNSEGNSRMTTYPAMGCFCPSSSSSQITTGVPPWPSQSNHSSPSESFIQRCSSKTRIAAKGLNTMRGVLLSPAVLLLILLEMSCLGMIGVSAMSSGTIVSARTMKRDSSLGMPEESNGGGPPLELDYTAASLPIAGHNMVSRSLEDFSPFSGGSGLDGSLRRRERDHYFRAIKRGGGNMMARGRDHYFRSLKRAASKGYHALGRDHYFRSLKRAGAKGYHALGRDHYFRTLKRSSLPADVEREVAEAVAAEGNQVDDKEKPEQAEEEENEVETEKQALELVKRYGASYISRLMGYTLEQQPTNLQQLLAASQFEPGLAADLLTCIGEVRGAGSRNGGSRSSSSWRQQQQQQQQHLP